MADETSEPTEPTPWTRYQKTIAVLVVGLFISCGITSFIGTILFWIGSALSAVLIVILVIVVRRHEKNKRGDVSSDRAENAERHD
ncbi:hypothetical protein [Homoserinibacter sp. GY 40078]|uniref:hypothetical protein n=1 Tax=Homoserinibacter sp. GY 40078 TaxID=2603275 RepID=UPI0011C9ADC1|nr:hypothetical protein [Homoserinibacter sp. GY 40078]TXK18752.1 hypothetical protein FVQ89_02080 [Homoserinibacter sp. GY 40078]